VSDTARHLRPVEDEVDPLLVHPDSGERLGVLSDHVQHLHDQIAGLETDVRAWRTRHANLKRDKEQEARKHALWPAAVEVFKHWQQTCRHPRSQFTAERFWLVEPFLARHGKELCMMAIDGAAFDPFTKKRKNGSVKRFDDWELIFRNEGKTEEFVNRAPKKRPDAEG